MNDGHVEPREGSATGPDGGESSDGANPPGEANPPGGTDVRTAVTEKGRRVAYVEYGDAAGVPVVFLHGTPGSRLLGSLWDGPARRAGVRVLAPDRPGYGRSPPTDARTLRDAGSVVAAVLDDVGVSHAGLVGFSGGGPHALAAAATRPERVRGVDVVAGAVPPSLRGTPPFALRLLERLASSTPTLARGLARAQAWTAARASPSFVVSQYTTGDADLPEETAELVKRDFLEAFARHRRGFVAETRLLSESWDFDPEAVTAAVRLWHGGRDANVPVAGARRLADRLPEATLTEFEDADHLRTLLRSREPILDRWAAEADASRSADSAAEPSDEIASEEESAAGASSSTAESSPQS